MTTSDIPPIIKSTSGKRPFLPHQKNNLKPEEIIEMVQEAPKEYISPDKKEEAEINHRNQQAYKELKQMEEERLARLLKTTQKIKNNLKDLHNTLKSA